MYNDGSVVTHYAQPADASMTMQRWNDSLNASMAENLLNDPDVETVGMTNGLVDDPQSLPPAITTNTAGPLAPLAKLQSSISCTPATGISLHPPSLGFWPLNGASMSFLTFPKWSRPVGAGDWFLANLLVEARNEFVRGSFDMSKPSLSGALKDPPPDVVAYRLFLFSFCFRYAEQHSKR